jgi:hypothetical protein
MADAAGRPALLVLARHGQSQRNIVKKQNRFYLDDEPRGTMWRFRYVLERWRYEEAERRFAPGHNPNCAVAAYRFNEGSGPPRAR